LRTASRGGVIAATAFTLFVVPVAYALLGRRTGSPGDVARRLESELAAPAAKPQPVAEVKTADRPAAE
jgi:multidrug efflux pump